MLVDDVVVGAVVTGDVAGVEALVVIPPGIQPPPTQVPPPIERNGSGVVQLLADDDGVEAPVVVTGVLAEPVGTQPPPTHVPPPIPRNGSGVVQAPGADADAVMVAATVRLVSPDTLT